MNEYLDVVYRSYLAVVNLTRYRTLRRRLLVPEARCLYYIHHSKDLEAGARNMPLEGLRKYFKRKSVWQTMLLVGLVYYAEEALSMVIIMKERDHPPICKDEDIMERIDPEGSSIRPPDRAMYRNF